MRLKEGIISGAKWTTISTVVTALIQILRLSILTKFLNKSDFGIVAILTFALGVTNTFADLGFSASIMHKQHLTRKEFSSLYWIQFAFFIVLLGIGIVVSPLIASFYNETSIKYLLPIVLIDLLFNGIGRLYDTILQKDMLFKTIAIRNIVSASLSIVVAFILAYMGYGIYSMILSTLFQTALFNIWNYVRGQKYIRLQLTVSISDSIPLLKIGIYQTGTQILDYFSAKFDVLIIGKLLGTETLGVYNLAKELIMKVILLINSVANKIVLPIFAKVQEDKRMLQSTYCQVIRLLSRINFPISVTICVLSTQIVDTLYGSGYKDVSVLISILSIWSLFLCIGNPIGSIAIATGKTNLSFVYTIVRVVVTIPCLYIASTMNIIAVAWCNVFIAFVMFLIGWRMLLYKMLKLSFGDYVSSFKKELILAIVICIPMLLIVKLNILHLPTNLIIEAGVYGIFIFTIYIGLYIKFYGRDFYKTLK